MQTRAKPREHAGSEKRWLAQPLEVHPAAAPVRLGCRTVKRPPLKLNALHEIARWVETGLAAIVREGATGDAQVGAGATVHGITPQM